MKVLVVEDDDDARELLAMMLESYDVRAVATVDGALRAIEDERPTLIVSDLRLRNDNARRLVAEVAKHDLPIPFLIISGFVDNADEPEGLIRAYLAKPFESADLLKAVASAMNGQVG